MALTREQFLAARVDLPREEVPVPGLGGSVFVRVMTAGERDRFEGEHTGRVGREKFADFRARLVVAAACDADGVPLFTPADVAAVSALPVAAVEPIVEAALRLNGFGKDGVEAERKNSESGHSSGSKAASH